MKMRLSKLLVPLAFSILFSSGVAVASELNEVDVSDFIHDATGCYDIHWNGMGLTTGEAIKLCSGTTNAAATMKCFMKAFNAVEFGGLGLSKGLAINLCKNNSEPFYSYN